MEAADVATNWITGVIIFALGIGAGFLLAWLALPHRRRVRQLEHALEDAQQEITEYRGQVNKHFKRTAELFEEMTQRYREIYRHLATGAQTLCEERPQSLQLDFPERSNLPGSGTDKPPPEKKDTDEPVTPQARPGDQIDETFLGDAPHVPELDEIVENQPEPPAKSESKTGG